MKKNLLLFGAVMVASSTFTSCSTQDVPEKPRNYYGVEPTDNGTPKEAYYAFAAAAFGLIVLIAWGLKKIRK